MKSKVYFSKNNLEAVYRAINPQFSGKTGIKVHFGEKGNITHLDPKDAKDVYELAKKQEENVSLIECNVLYRGSRTNKTDHLKTAKEHGFDFAPIDICDGEDGQDKWEIEVNQKHFDKIMVGAGLKNYKNMIVLSHFKGHGANGFGGALKNIGMGLGSRAGKMAMHSAFSLIINEEKCVGCGVCEQKCDACAIKVVEGRAQIDFDKCIRCAGCIANCPQEAVETPWGSNSPEDLQERIVEYCYGIMKEIKVVANINVLKNITKSCDCLGEPMKSIFTDIGYLGSVDPVAVDQASIDIILKMAGKDIFRELNNIDSTRQLEYGEKLGLGNRDYELIEL